MKLPDNFRQNVMRIMRNHGVAWLDMLKSTIKVLAQKWQLTDIQTLENLSFNYVARAYSKQFSSDVILKICMPDGGFKQEKQALEYYDGKGSVRLIVFDEFHHAMLLESIIPGTPLKTLFPERDEQAVEVAVQEIKKLHTQPLATSHNFPTMPEWLSLFDTLELPHELKKPVAIAREIANKLHATQKNQYLLHGDLHHENILRSSDNSWKAIDPKGVVGELAYEVGAFMCNPGELMMQSKVKDIIAHRLDGFSKLLDIDRVRLANACYVRVMLSVCWTVQDRGNWSDDLKCAELVKAEV
jgi:streptomycin 6-kinase